MYTYEVIHYKLTYIQYIYPIINNIKLYQALKVGIEFGIVKKKENL